MKLALSAVEVVEQSREPFAYDGCQVLLENLRADIPTAGEPRANHPKVAARCSASAATFFCAWCEGLGGLLLAVSAVKMHPKLSFFVKYTVIIAKICTFALS